MAALAGELTGRPLTWAAADVTDRTAIANAVHQVETSLGPTDRLIACAGIGRGTPADTLSAVEFEEIVRVNLVGVANSVAAVLPGMIARKKGHLVALSSLASFWGVPRMAAYCASKAGLNALFDSLAMELAPYRIQVSVVCPGFIRTPMTTALQHEFRDMMELDVAVGRILNAIAKKKRFVAFPIRAALMLRILRCLPATWADWVMRRRAKNFLGDGGAA